MDNSCSSSTTTSVSFSHPREEPEVTLEDVAEVVARLNKKVSQLRKELLGSTDSPRSKKSKGQEGSGMPERRKSQTIRERYESYEEDYVPRRRQSSSTFIRKKSNLPRLKDFHRKSTDRTSSAVSLSEDLDTIKRRQLKHPETRKMSYVHGKHRQKSTLPIEPDEFTDSGRIRNRRDTSEFSSSEILSYESRDETTRTNSNARRQIFTSGEIMAEKVSRRNPKYSHRNENRDSGFREILKNSNRSKNYDELPRKSLTEHERTRILLPSRVSANSQGIRHAFGLSKDFCNRDATGSAVRRARRKKISRGVQCLINSPKESKNERYCGLGGCFAFKSSSPKTKGSRRKISQSFTDKDKSLESSETYKPRNTIYEKEASAFIDNAVEPSRELRNKTTLRNGRMRGGAGQDKSQKYEQSKMHAPMNFEISDETHCQQRKFKSIMDQTSQKNDVTDVKRRLTKCLIELNGIIGDVNYMFQETKQHC